MPSLVIMSGLSCLGVGIGPDGAVGAFGAWFLGLRQATLAHVDCVNGVGGNAGRPEVPGLPVLLAADGKTDNNTDKTTFWSNPTTIRRNILLFH